MREKLSSSQLQWLCPCLRGAGLSLPVNDIDPSSLNHVCISHPNLLASPSREQLLSGSAMKALERKHALQSDVNSSPALPLNWLCNPRHTPYFSGPQGPPMRIHIAFPRGCNQRMWEQAEHGIWHTAGQQQRSVPFPFRVPSSLCR